MLPDGTAEIDDPTPEARQAWDEQIQAVDDYNRKLLAEAQRKRDPNSRWIRLRDVFWWRQFHRQATSQILSWLEASDPDLASKRVVSQEYRQELIEPTNLRTELETALKSIHEQELKRVDAQTEHDGFSKKLRPDLDEKTRRWYKRQSKAAIIACDNIIATSRKTVQRLRKQIQRWPNDPKHYRKVPIPGTGTEVMVPGPSLREVLTESLIGRASIQKAELDAYATASDPLQPKYKGYAVFENRLLKEVMKSGLIFCPLDAAYDMCPWLEPYTPIDHGHDQIENKLVIKTGGAQIGGRVIGAGWRRTGDTLVPRRLTTFENSGEAGVESAPSGDTGDNDSWAGDVDAGDA